ncbi:hypothetical protein BRADI_4g10090v3 [Brachypodium distachyon]|uniref:Uncharacterized protein n=1 Tax=Brachypodium distachyon TaxID=15368 RepID=A0A0Q3HFW5_BRADI|nr:hypothetical protein BRADI_4g10090v3 [Brachypodium distachyon]
MATLPHPPLHHHPGGAGAALPDWDPSLIANPDFDLGFLQAAFEGDLRTVKKAVRVLGRGAEGRRLAEKLEAVRDGFGMGLLHRAALGGSLPVCRYLVEHVRMDIDVLGPHGTTPLDAALARQNMELARYFLEQGADTEMLDADGYTPLHFAASQGDVGMVELLLSKGAHPDTLNHGGTVLHYAATHGRDDILKVLLDHHADHKKALSGTGYTALVLATIAHSLKCVQLLLEAGADVDGVGKETPLMIAATAGATDILKCLVLAGADANVPDSLGRAPIEIAARSGRREDVEILFPVTSLIPGVREWSVDGIISHVKSVRPEKKAMLASAKSKANEAFKDGNYLVAARIYEEAMALNPLGPSNATLLSNSSLCWLRFGNGEKALKDAKVCRMLRPGWPKACYREGTALMLLKASCAFLDGLKLEPRNVEMEDGLRKAMESLKISRCSPAQD